MAVQPTTVPNEDYEPNDRAQQVLAVLKDEQRANPMLLRERTGLRKQYVNNALRSLVDAGWVRKVTDGLYELSYSTDQGEAESVDMAALKHALDDAEAAAERGDGSALQDALRRAREAINGE
jgi:DNA-binding MarR family transcriptional regulator